eukprot:260994-Amphidinium_carterae.1
MEPRKAKDVEQLVDKEFCFRCVEEFVRMGRAKWAVLVHIMLWCCVGGSHSHGLQLRALWAGP